MVALSLAVPFKKKIIIHENFTFDHAKTNYSSMIHADHPAFVDVQRLAAGNVSFSRLGPRRVRIAVKAAMWMLAGLLTSAYCWRPGVFESVVVNLGVVLPEPMNVFDDPVRKYCLYVLGAGTVLGARFAVSFDEPFLFLILLLLVAFDSLFLKHHFLVGSIIRMAIWKYSLSVRHREKSYAADDDFRH